MLLRGEELAVDVRDRNLLVVDLHRPDCPRRDVLDAADAPKVRFRHQPERNNRVKNALEER